MKPPRRMAAVLACLLLQAAAASAADIVVMSSGGFTAPLLEVIAEFEHTSGHRIVTVFGASMGGAADSIPSRLARGERADVIIVAAEALEQLIADGRVAPGTRTDLVRSRIGMAVRAGAPKPDISTVDALVRTLLEAQSIAYSASASGTYLSTELFPRLGIADRIRPKSRRIVSERVGTVVARGEAEIGFQQISELLPIEGIDYVGPLPDEVQRVTIFAAGLAADAAQPGAARDLIEFLATAPVVARAIEKYGLDPVRDVTQGTATAPLLPQLRILAPAAPGGGWDQTARAMQQALQNAGLVGTAPVENVPGAAGTIALARFIGSERGAGDTLMVSGLIMLGAIVTHGSPVTLDDVTPIARLTGEYEVIAVPAASPIRSLADLTAALRARPEAISWGGGSAGGSDQILAGLVAEAAGVPAHRVNYIAFSGGGESLAAILGGQVSVGVNGLAELAPYIESGAIRALAISSAERLPGLDVPTLREQGLDIEFENWRSIVAPPGISREDRRRLETIVGAMVASDEWRETLARFRWLDRYLTGPEFERFVTAEAMRVRAILRQFGQRSDEAVPKPADFYPFLVLTGLVAAGIAAAAQSRRASRSAAIPLREHARGAEAPGQSQPKRRPSPGDLHEEEAQRWRPIVMLATGTALTVFTAEPAGFVAAAAVLFWCTARAFDTRHPLRDAVFAVLVSLGAYLLFSRVLQLPLPAGPLERWL